MTEIPPMLAQEHCFLCEPQRDLIFFESENFVALAGLGPLADGYSVMGAKQHFKSMADVPPPLRAERDNFLNAIRERLAETYTRCLVTEHGRMAVCSNDDHEQHCYHAHFLIFPAADDIFPQARTYFGHSQSFGTLDSALQYGASCEEYFLISPMSDLFVVLSMPLNIPRQLARLLVAHTNGNAHLADWRSHPDLSRALAIAGDLRPMFDRKK